MGCFSECQENTWTKQQENVLKNVKYYSGWESVLVLQLRYLSMVVIMNFPP